MEKTGDKPRVALVYNRNQRVGIGERCQRVLEAASGLSATQFDLKDIRSVKSGFDLYLRLDDGDYGEPFPDLHPYAWWVADTHIGHAFRKIAAHGARCDHLFCFQKEGAERVSRQTGKTVHWLPAAADYCSPSPVFVPHAKRKWDIAFIGTTGKFSLRKVALELIKSEYPNSFIGTAPHTELFQYYSNARIVVNYAINNDINMRAFEAAGAGALVLNYRIVNNGFEEIFKAGENCAVFSDVTTPELKENIDFYRANPAYVERIAKNGFDLVNSQHTYKHRLDAIFRTVGLDVVI